MPLEPLLAERASQLAAQAVATLPDPFGYIGVDLVLGHDPEGRDDVVIEINPRLTTSYVGLRAAGARTWPPRCWRWQPASSLRLSFTGQAVEFRADGTLLK